MIYGKFTAMGRKIWGLCWEFGGFLPPIKKKNCLEDAMATEMEEL